MNTFKLPKYDVRALTESTSFVHFFFLMAHFYILSALGMEFGKKLWLSKA